MDHKSPRYTALYSIIDKKLISIGTKNVSHTVIIPKRWVQAAFPDGKVWLIYFNKTIIMVNSEERAEAIERNLEAAVDVINLPRAVAEGVLST